MLKIKNVNLSKSTFEQLHITDKLVPESELTRKLQLMGTLPEQQVLLIKDARH